VVPCGYECPALIMSVKPFLKGGGNADRLRRAEA
jgi:hypothetical protein